VPKRIDGVFITGNLKQQRSIRKSRLAENVNSARVEQGEENYSWLLFYHIDGRREKI
jgi:hypothetical protein